MFIDARELAEDTVVDADICIVGAGPAGITLAREFIGLRHNVILLESGGLRLDGSLQALGQPGENRIADAGPLAARRQFGGNASSWTVNTDRGKNSVRLARLSESDFKARDWIGNSGWPIQRADLDRHYERARGVFKLNGGGYDADCWESDSARRLTVPDDLETEMFQFGTGGVFTRDYRRDLERSPDVLVYHHATAVELETNSDASRVTAVRLASAPGREFRVRAKWVVLSGGGMTCAQLLLLSDRVQPEGLGNRHGLVGRYFMDHPLLLGGRFIPASDRLFEAMTFYDLRTVGGVPIMGHLQISEAAQQRDKLLQLSMLFFPRREDYLARQALTPRQDRGFQSAKRMRAAFKRGELPTKTDLRRVVRGIDGVAKRALMQTTSPGATLGRGGWSKRLDANHKYGVFEVIHQAEQPPRWENRIYLSEARDALGSRKIGVDWTWNDEDMAETMRSQDLFADSLERAGLGRYEISRPEGKPEVLVHSTAHYMGTTRMHADPRQGVVDAECRVHGVDNLYVASSSVFTTGGFANPTMTVLALALRISDHIRSALETALPLI